jgi:restriction system protein
MWSLRLAIKSATIGLALSLIAAAQETPWRYAVKPGDSRDQVVQTYGEPKSAAKTGNREVLLYSEGRVVLQDGKLLELHFARTEPHFVYAQERIVNPPPPAPTAAPVTPIASSGSAPPAETRRPSSLLQDVFAQPVRLAIGGVICLLGFLLWLRNRHARSLDVARLPEPLSAGESSQPAATPASREAVSPFSPLSLPVPLPYPATKPPTLLTQDLLQELDWKRFDELVAASFHAEDWRADLAKPDDDGDVDVYLYRGGASHPFAYVHCKSWHDGPVGAKPVRALFGVMAAGGVSEGWFVATGDFTPEALEYATGKNLHLLTGGQFVEQINALPSGPRTKLLAAAFQGDCRTPTCPRCGVKMILRSEAPPYWRCANYPRCRATYAIRASRPNG